MLHALLHATSEREQRWYLITSLIWITLCTISMVPMLVGTSYDTVYNIINHLATSIFYALAGGILFWIALYYIWIDRKHADRRDTIVCLVIFGGMAALGWLVGFFA